MAIVKGVGRDTVPVAGQELVIERVFDAPAIWSGRPGRNLNG